MDRPPVPRRREVRKLPLVVIAAGLGLAISGAGWAAASVPSPAPPTTTATWPAQGAAAIRVDDEVLLGPDATTPRPMASLAKLITALVVLDALPLAEGEQGPTFVMDADDVSAYESARAQGGQSVPVVPGERLTQRQMLELMMVASSNNHASSLVDRTFGDEERFLTAARSWLTAHGLESVTLVDATGMSPGDLASAEDSLEIGRLAEASPVLAALGAQTQTTPLPTADGSSRSFSSTNDMLGVLGIDGLKTGHTDAAGYNAIITGDLGGNDDRRILVVVLGSPSEAQRSIDVAALLVAARSGR